MEKHTSHRLPKGRAQLLKVLLAAGNVIRIADVVAALSVSRVEAAKRLSRWREQGWVSRVGAGAYVPASLDTLGTERVLDDGWVLVPALFYPGYVAGRTAAEHWDLTEQIFKDVAVVTGQAIRRKSETRQGFEFTLKHLNPAKICGTQIVWRHQTKVPVSDIHRTIVDMLDDPAIGGVSNTSPIVSLRISNARTGMTRNSSSTARGLRTVPSSNGLDTWQRNMTTLPRSSTCAERD